MKPVPAAVRASPVDAVAPAAARQRGHVASRLAEVRNSADARPQAADRKRSLPGGSGVEAKRSAATAHITSWEFDDLVHACKAGKANEREVSKAGTILLRGASDVSEAASRFSRVDAALQSLGMQPESHHWTAWIKRCTQAHDLPAALQVLERMQAHDPPFTPNVYQFNAVMKAYAADADMEGNRRLLGRMQAQNVPPDRYTYGMLVDTLANTGDGEQAEALFREVKRRSLQDAELRPGNPMFGSVIKAWALGQSPRDCWRLIQEMQADARRPLTPDLTMYGLALGACAQTGDGETALALMRDMDKLGLRPSRDMFTMAMKAQVRTGDAKDWKGFDALFEDALRRARRHPELQPEAETWNTALRGRVRAGEWQRAFPLYERMQASATPPNVDTYRFLLTACREAGRTGDVVRLVDDAIRAGVFTRSAGYEAPSAIDLHAEQVIHPAHQGEHVAYFSGMTAGLALALLDWHQARGHLRAHPHFIVGKGDGVVRDAILAELQARGHAYEVDRKNAGRLVPATPRASAAPSSHRPDAR